MTSMEEQVLNDMYEWQKKNGFTFETYKDLIEAYWKDYFNEQRSA